SHLSMQGREIYSSSILAPLYHYFQALLSTAGCPQAAELPLRAGWGWVSSGGHSPPAGCRSSSLQTCSLSRQPLGFLWKTSASHSPCKEQRHPERSLAPHRAKAGSKRNQDFFFSGLNN
uniref:Uncharacterized protein n=1 Tax=Ficedula albicollis TaxID=59894 RepID=A0A803V870_FICAL